MKNVGFYVRFFLVGLFSYCCPPLLAQEEDVEEVSFVSDNVIKKELGLPVVRSVYGGTKIIPEFEGNWTNEMKGAFEYACKIWEEAMPTTFPIRIKVILDETNSKYQDKPVFSTITTKALYLENIPRVPTPRTYRLQIKGTKFHEFSGQSDTKIYDEILTSGMFVEPDAVIRYYNYNNKLINNCSFSLEGVSDERYYDFVTIALRDMAKSFGLIWTSKIRSESTLNVSFKNTPFEKCIINALNSNGNAEQAYANATKGSLKVECHYGGAWTLYAPTEWDADRSLNYFIPEEGKKITELLSYDFGRGTVVRDISCYDTYHNVFRNLLEWKGDIAVGITGATSCGENPYNTDNVIPYKGIISSSTGSQKAVSTANKVSATNGVSKVSSEGEDLDIHLDQYHPNLDSNGRTDQDDGLRVALLKKDGTWDVVYDVPMYFKYAEVNTANFVLHEDIDAYARSCDGYLRSRVTKFYMDGNRKHCSSEYYLLDYLPQRINVKKSMVMPCEDEKDYYRDVKIGLKDIEGVSRVVVSQLDEGEELPFEYEVPDFKKGYFVATVDKEYSSTFTITAYNKNGSTVSYPYVLEPLTPSSVNVDFTFYKDKIFVEATSRKFDGDSLVSWYEIKPITVLSSRSSVLGKRKNTLDGNVVNISSLPHGYYVLTVCDVQGKEHTFKFSK